MKKHRVAVVGAGIAGLAAARSLHDHGFAVTLLERGRGVGGRSAHRLRDGHGFDHGAQYFTAREPQFERQLEIWLERGLVAPWKGRIVTLGTGGAVSAATPKERYVGVPGMDAMATHLARGLDVYLRHAVSEIVRDAGLWSLTTDSGGRLGPFDAVILAMPPEQALRLKLPSGLLEAASGAKLLPCWCAMAAFGIPLAVDFVGAIINGDSRAASSLRWVARDSSKPGREAGERWVIHASANWSAQRLADPPDTVARELLGHFFEALDVAPLEPDYLVGHRWSFARPTTEDDLDCLWSTEHALALCGDWCRGARIEDAYLSGVAAAGRVIGTF